MIVLYLLQHKDDDLYRNNIASGSCTLLAYCTDDQFSLNSISVFGAKVMRKVKWVGRAGCMSGWLCLGRAGTVGGCAWDVQGEWVAVLGTCRVSGRLCLGRAG